MLRSGIPNSLFTIQNFATNGWRPVAYFNLKKPPAVIHGGGF